MLLYRFRIWKSNDEIRIDDDVYTQEVSDEVIKDFYQPNNLYQMIVPGEKEGDPVLYIIFCDNKEKIIEYVKGFGLGMEIIPSRIPINIYKNPFRVAKPNEELAEPSVPDGVE